MIMRHTRWATGTSGPQDLFREERRLGVEGIHTFQGGSYGVPFVPPGPVLIPSVSSKAPKRKLVGLPAAPPPMYRDQDQGFSQRVGPAPNRLENDIFPSMTTGTPTHSGIVAQHPGLPYLLPPRPHASPAAPLLTEPQPYSVFNPVPWHSATPMMLPTQHTFAFTPRVPPGWASVAPGGHQQRGQTAQLGQLGPQMGYPIPQFPVMQSEPLSSSVRRAPSTIPPGNAQAGPSSGVRLVEEVPQPKPRKSRSKPEAGKTYEVVP